MDLAGRADVGNRHQEDQAQNADMRLVKAPDHGKWQSFVTEAWLLAPVINASDSDDMTTSGACLDMHLGHIEGAGETPHEDSVAAHRKSGSRQGCGTTGSRNIDRADGIPVDQDLRLGAGGGAGGSETYSKNPLG